MRRIAAYGAPLAATGAFGFLIGNADRFLLGWLLGDAAVGRYAVAYDLASFALGLLLMVVNLAAYPLAVRALQEHGPAAARIQYEPTSGPCWRSVFRRRLALWFLRARSPSSCWAWVFAIRRHC